LVKRKIRLRPTDQIDDFDCNFMERILQNGNRETRQRLEEAWSQSAVEYELFRLHPPGFVKVERGKRGKMTLSVTMDGVAAVFNHRRMSGQSLDYEVSVEAVPGEVSIYASMAGVEKPSMTRSFHLVGAEALAKEIVRTTWLWHLDILEKEPVTPDTMEAQLIVNVKFPVVPRLASHSPSIHVEGALPELASVVDHLWFFLTLAPTYHIEKIWMRLDDLRMASDQAILAGWEKMRELYYLNVNDSSRFKRLYKRNLGSPPSRDEGLAYNILFGTLEELYQKHEKAAAWPPANLTYRIAHAIVRSRSIHPAPQPPPMRRDEPHKLTAVKLFRTIVLQNFSENESRYITRPK
jgi:hypothetical protein